MMTWLRANLRRLKKALRYCRTTTPAEVGPDYDRRTVALMTQLLDVDSCCVDVGAHRGDILQHMLRLAPAGRHYAVEPLPQLAEELRQRYPRARIHEVAVCDRSGTADYCFVENAPAYSGLRPRLYDRPDPILRTLSVSTTTLDAILADEPKIAFLKLDIEGGEYHALLGGAETIRRTRPVIVFEAGSRSTGQYGVSADDLYRLVTGDFGYQLTTLQRHAQGVTPFTAAEFSGNWERGPDYFFLAYPPESPIAPQPTASRAEPA